MTDFTDKERLFISAYLDCLNGAEAARRAGYSPRTARERAYELLTKPHIKIVIEAGLKERAMPRDEILARLAAIARADIRDLFDFDEATGKMARLNLHHDAPLHLIKSVTPTAKGIKVELHDALAALDKLARIQGMFVDRQEVSGPSGGPLQVREIVIELPNEPLDHNP